MSGRRLGLLILLSYGVMEVSSLSRGAIASIHQTVDLQPHLPDAQIAQSSELGCRQTNATTGVYEEPNPDSTALGILPVAQTVRLEVLGTGTGWTRISQPLVGWIKARYLTPNAPCGSLGAGLAGSPTVPVPSPSHSSSNPSTDSQPPGMQPPLTSARCNVLPPSGLAVRSAPTVADDTYLTTLLPGTYLFKFTGATKTDETPEGTRRWVYITAPEMGWISLGLGGESNLGGQECG